MRYASLLGTAALAVALGACGGSDTAEAEEAVAVDSVLVEALVDAQIAEARAELRGLGPAEADSLREAVLTAHALTGAALEARLADLADDPERAGATYAAVADRLTQLRQSAPRRP